MLTSAGRPEAGWATITTITGPELRRELAREAAGSFVLMFLGGGATVLAHHAPAWQTPLIAAGFSLGQMAATTITGGPRLRVSPAASLLSWRRDQVGALQAASSAVVQVATMILASAVVIWSMGSTAGDLVETTPSLVQTALVVAGASAIWFAVLLRQPAIPVLGIAYFLIHLVGLPLDGGTLNPARTLAPVLLGGSGATAGGLAAFGLVPVAVAAVMGRKRLGHRS